MTYQRYIEGLTNEELADILSLYDDCNSCPIKKYCDERPDVYECNKIWIDWLENELKR